MRQFKFILSLFLILAIGAPAYADTLIERFENAELYNVDENTRKLVVGGEISNAEPFEVDGPMVPQSYNWSDIETIAPDVYRLKKGKFGYTIYKATGKIRIHPVRKRWDIYYSISNSSPVALSHRQINNKLLELYVDTPQVRYSFFIGDRGFKVNSRLKDNYSGGDEWSHTYNVALQGLIRTGRTLFFNGEPVGKLPNPFMVDAEGAIAPVVESLNGGQLTLTASDISSYVLPIDIDPTLGPIGTSQDTYLRSAVPTTGAGAATELRIERFNINKVRVLELFDLSAIPSTSTIITASLGMYITFDSSAGDLNVNIHRCTRTDWEEGNGAGNPANWNQFKSGTNWTTAGGDVDGTVEDDFLHDGSAGAKTYDIINNVSDAVANRSGNLSMLFKWNDESSSNSTLDWASKENATPVRRPALTVEYVIPSGTIRTSLGYPQMVF